MHQIFNTPFKHGVAPVIIWRSSEDSYDGWLRIFMITISWCNYSPGKIGYPLNYVTIFLTHTKPNLVSIPSKPTLVQSDDACSVN